MRSTGSRSRDLRAFRATVKKTCRDTGLFGYVCAHLAFGHPMTPTTNGATDADGR